MKKWFSCCLCLIALVCRAQVQPANFMIGELTFEVPSTWKWIDVATENEKARMYIFDPVLKEKAIVSFELMSSDAGFSFVEKWKDPYLSQEPPPEVHLETNKVNQYGVITANIFGTKIVNKQPATNQATHGVVIEIKGEQIGARILGARSFVEKLKPVFSRIIKEALKNDE